MMFLVPSSLINLAICEFLYQHRFPSVPSNIPHPRWTVRPIAYASVQSHPRQKLCSVHFLLFSSFFLFFSSFSFFFFIRFFSVRKRSSVTRSGSNEATRRTERRGDFQLVCVGELTSSHHQSLCAATREDAFSSFHSL